MAEALCSGVVGVAARATRGAALAESVPMGGGYTTRSRRSSFPGGRMAVAEKKGRPLPRTPEAAPGQMNLLVCKSMRWWEKGVQPNMREIQSAQDLADSLLHAGDKLVVVDFFSPGCGGCRALHPKICQLAEKNPEVAFLQVNYEAHKSMCYSLHVHVLPFFRFYRGAHGRVASFSCTVATVAKFKHALAKHATDRCGLGTARGLDDSELMALADNRDLNFTYHNHNDKKLAEAIINEAASSQAGGGGPWLPLPASATQLLLVDGSSESSFLSSAGTGR